MKQSPRRFGRTSQMSKVLYTLVISMSYKYISDHQNTHCFLSCFEHDLKIITYNVRDSQMLLRKFHFLFSFICCCCSEKTIFQSAGFITPIVTTVGGFQRLVLLKSSDSLRRPWSSLQLWAESSCSCTGQGWMDAPAQQLAAAAANTAVNPYSASKASCWRHALCQQDLFRDVLVTSINMFAMLL